MPTPVARSPPIEHWNHSVTRLRRGAARQNPAFGIGSDTPISAHLINFAMDSENRLCLLLVGLTELRRRLAMAVHESLVQRLVVRHHLAGIERSELDDYLVHRLRLAGCELPLFEPPAVEALAQSTRGLPRLVNRIAHYALTAAAAKGARTVSAEHLEHAVVELRL